MLARLGLGLDALHEYTAGMAVAYTHLAVENFANEGVVDVVSIQCFGDV